MSASHGNGRRCSITSPIHAWVIRLAVAALADAQEPAAKRWNGMQRVNRLRDTMMHKLVDRAFETLLQQHSYLDNTLLGKSGQVAIPRPACCPQFELCPATFPAPRSALHSVPGLLCRCHVVCCIVALVLGFVFHSFAPCRRCKRGSMACALLLGPVHWQRTGNSRCVHWGWVPSRPAAKAVQSRGRQIS